MIDGLLAARNGLQLYSNIDILQLVMMVAMLPYSHGGGGCGQFSLQVRPI